MLLINESLSAAERPRERVFKQLNSISDTSDRGLVGAYRPRCDMCTAQGHLQYNSTGICNCKAVFSEEGGSSAVFYGGQTDSVNGLAVGLRGRL